MSTHLSVDVFYNSEYFSSYYSDVSTPIEVWGSPYDQKLLDANTRVGPTKSFHNNLVQLNILLRLAPGIWV